MINAEKGHVFFWRSRDFRPVRTFFSLLLAGAILFILITKVPLPFVAAKQAQENYKTERMLNSQNLKPVIVVPASRLTSSGITSHFSYNDPLNSAETVRQIVDNTVNAEAQIILQGYEKQRPAHQIQYADIPYTLPKLTETKIVQPEIPARDPVPLRLPPAPPIEFLLVAKATPPVSIDNPPFLELGKGREHVAFEISTSPAGEVSYALPIDLEFKNEALEKWIYELQFPASENGKSYRVDLTMVRK